MDTSIPFFMQRFRSVQTDGGEIWRQTFETLRAHRAACDEVWFSTGIGLPKLDWHREHAARIAAAAADCRSAGIAPALQFQTTIGHSDDIVRREGADGVVWSGYTGEHGVACRFCACPRDPAFLDYLEAMADIYAPIGFSSIWIDDDLRLNNHLPAVGWSTGDQVPGCWCPRCVAAFSAEEGAAYTRETLSAAVRADSALYDRWEAFGFESLTEIARRIAARVHALAPETRMGYQHALWRNGSQVPVYRALAEASGHKVRSRPGGGAYFDHNPYEQIEKAYVGMSQRVTLEGAKDVIEQFCPEIETCPRTFACRTGRGLLLEALYNLSLGMDSVSVFATDGTYEPPAWYGEALLEPFVRNRPLLERLAGLVRGGALAAGMRMPVTAPSCGDSSSGIPLITGAGKAFGCYLTDAAVARLSDEALARLARGGVILSCGGLEALVRRGLGDRFGGLSFQRVDSMGPERFTGDPLNHGFAGLCRPCEMRLSPTFEHAETIRVLGEILDNRGRPLAPATVLATLSDGSRIAVLGAGRIDSTDASAARLLQLYRIVDWGANGAFPVLPEAPVQAFVEPLVADDGALKSVSVTNTTIDTARPLPLLLRGVPPEKTKAEWHVLDEAPVELPIMHHAQGARVVLPPLAAWCGGVLLLG